MHFSDFVKAWTMRERSQAGFSSLTLGDIGICSNVVLIYLLFAIT
jgi:hypothetical protein